jgi:hypothetical protein
MHLEIITFVTREGRPNHASKYAYRNTRAKGEVGGRSSVLLRILLRILLLKPPLPVNKFRFANIIDPKLAVQC